MEEWGDWVELGGWMEWVRVGRLEVGEWGVVWSGEVG